MKKREQKIFRTRAGFPEDYGERKRPVCRDRRRPGKSRGRSATTKKEYCRAWKETKSWPVQQEYALCRCGQSKNKPFCDGFHLNAHFDGTGGRRPRTVPLGAEVTEGPTLTLQDNEHFCVHVRPVSASGRGARGTSVRSRISRKPGRQPSRRPATAPRGVLSSSTKPKQGKRSSPIWRSPLSSSSTRQRVSTGRSGSGAEFRSFLPTKALRGPEPGHPLPVREVPEQADSAMGAISGGDQRLA